MQIVRQIILCRFIAVVAAITSTIGRCTEINRNLSRSCRQPSNASWAVRRRGPASGRGSSPCSWPRTERHSSTCAVDLWYTRSGCSLLHIASSTCTAIHTYLYRWALCRIMILRQPVVTVTVVSLFEEVPGVLYCRTLFPGVLCRWLGSVCVARAE